MSKKLIVALSSIVLWTAASGCVVTGPGPSPAPGVGTLSAGWTLAGSSHAAECLYYQVDRVNVVIVDDTGFVVADEVPYCEDFGLSFDLSTGWYSSEVTLLDAGGYAVSDTVITDVSVPRDTVVYVDVNFPDGAIY
jgi:hypothetical protein